MTTKIPGEIQYCDFQSNSIKVKSIKMYLISISDKIRAERSRYFMRLVLVRQRDKLDILFRHYLCEDKAAPGASGASIDNFSYVDFLCHMHKEIRALLG